MSNLDSYKINEDRRKEVFVLLAKVVRDVHNSDSTSPEAFNLSLQRNIEIVCRAISVSTREAISEPRPFDKNEW